MKAFDFQLYYWLSIITLFFLPLFSCFRTIDNEGRRNELGMRLDWHVECFFYRMSLKCLLNIKFDVEGVIWLSSIYVIAVWHATICKRIKQNRKVI